MYHGISNTCTEAGKLAFPVKNKHKKKLIIPNWNDKLKPLGLRDKSVFWHHIWQDCGKPQIGSVTDIMKYSRCKYHSAVKKARKMATCHLQKHFPEIITKISGLGVKKMSKPKNTPNNIIIMTKFQLPGKRPSGRFGNFHFSFTGRYYLSYMCSNMHIKTPLILRFIKFYLSMFFNDNTIIVNYFAKRALHLCCGIYQKTL